MIRRALAAAVLVLGAAAPGRAGVFDRVEIGARGLALAAAYGAYVQDVSALHWNPAGLSFLERHELLLTHSRPYAVPDLAANSVLAGTRLGETGIALGWHRLGITDVVGENLITAGAGRWVYRDDLWTVHAGAALKLAAVSFSQDTPTRQLDTKTGITGDLGLLFQRGPSLRLGAVWRNLGEPDFDLVEGGVSTPMDGGPEFSVSYQWRPESAIMAGWDEVNGRAVLNYAGEIWFYEVFAIRAGVYDEEFSGGFGIVGSGWQVDGGFLTHQELGNSYRFSLLLHLDRESGRP